MPQGVPIIDCRCVLTLRQHAAMHPIFEAKNASICRILRHLNDSEEGCQRVLQRRNKILLLPRNGPRNCTTKV
jgi:hypothetical protein